MNTFANTMRAVLSLFLFPFRKGPGLSELRNVIVFFFCFFFSCFVSKGVLSVSKVLDRENPDMTLDAQERGVFSLDITATDQALSSNERKSSTVRVRVCFCFNVGSFVCLSVCLFGWLFVQNYVPDPLFCLQFVEIARKSFNCSRRFEKAYTQRRRPWGKTEIEF